jgi:hypothetical protein
VSLELKQGDGNVHHYERLSEDGWFRWFESYGPGGKVEGRKLASCEATVSVPTSRRNPYGFTSCSNPAVAKVEYSNYEERVCMRHYKEIREYLVEQADTVNIREGKVDE